MRYIRFLKTPRIEGYDIRALITIASDLGDSFCDEDLQLSASLRSADDHGELYLRRSFKWTAGSRTLPITFNIKDSDIDWPVRVHVAVHNSGVTDRYEQHHHGRDSPAVISAWSDVLDPTVAVIEAPKTVERRFTPLNNRTLSIWEETGESIARHIWDAGLALSAHLDRMIALQTEGLPLVEQTIGAATFKKLNVIELGSGCGIVGISLAQSIPDCDVLLTDLPEAHEIAERNIRCANPAMGSKVSFLELDWEKPLPATVASKSFDLILIADCTYNIDSGPSLVRTLRSLVPKTSKSIILLAMKVRHESELGFFDLMMEANFVNKPHLKLAIPGSNGESDEILVYVFHDKDRPSYAADKAGPMLHKTMVQFWSE